MTTMERLSSLKQNRKLLKNRIKPKNAVLYAMLFLLKKETRSAGFKFLHTIWAYFFAPQIMTKYHIKNRPVVWVDHELDRKIPFQPHHVAIYLSFTHLWVKSAAFLYREFGKKALPYIAGFINNLGSLYRESAKVYLQIQSTTNRPRYLGSFYFKVIHLLDPHLHCIPSLHVGVVGFTYSRISRLIQELADDPAQYQPEIDYLWRQTILITDSILFIKQHSVNCVSAGLFTLTSNNYGFSEQQAHKVIDAMFTGEGNTLDAAEELRVYIRSLYEYFLKENRTKSSARVLVDFLKNYSEETAAMRKIV
ncbi:MAG: hypothetical protein SVR04_03765 [Spirochaetota bacterium]|nr:hypothetical protein [Spirochaetota bacterium]